MYLPLDSSEALPAGLTEDALALDFTRRHGHELRYVHAWAKWFRESAASRSATDTQPPGSRVSPIRSGCVVSTAAR